MPKLKMCLFRGIFIVWLLLFIHPFFIIYLKGSIKNYLASRSLSLNEKRAKVMESDFFKFLLFCDEKIPKGKDIKWVFPADGPGNAYYWQSAYYYLYPRNYREDAYYIIVYRINDYNQPPGYGLLAQQAQDKYILFKQK